MTEEPQPPRSRSGLATPGAEALIGRAISVISAARPMPLSTSVMIGRDEILDLLHAALEGLPDECREARFLLREREEYLARARSEAEVVMDEARSRIAQMVQKTEVSRAAERRAREVVEEAEARARRRQHEVDEYCDRRLEQFDALLEQLHQTVASARAKLRPAPAPVADDPPSEEDLGPSSAFFDQDLA